MKIQPCSCQTSTEEEEGVGIHGPEDRVLKILIESLQIFMLMG